MTRTILATLALVAAVNVALALPPGERNARDLAAQSQTSPVPLRWVPSWLMDSLRRAIADATDPRDRHSDE